MGITQLTLVRWSVQPGSFCIPNRPWFVGLVSQVSVVYTADPGLLGGQQVVLCISELSMFNIIIYGSFFLDLSFLYNDISCGTRKKKLKKKHLKTQKCEKIHSAFFTSFFFIYLFCGMIKAVKCKKRFQKFKTQKKHLKIQNFEKSHSAFFAHFFFIYLFCEMIKAVKYKKNSKFKISKI